MTDIIKSMPDPFPKTQPELIDIPEIEEYNDYLEWTPQEEEEFLRILDEDHDDGYFKGL